MTLTIEDGESFAVEGTFREVADRGNIYIGKIVPGAEKTLRFSAYFPEEAGNEYQGATMRVNWTFTTEGGEEPGGEDPGGGGGGGGGRRDEDEEELPPTVEIEEEPTPAGEPEIPSDPPEPETFEVEIPEEEIPKGAPEIPETGEASPYPYYAVGTFAILTGVTLVRKKK